MEIIIEDIELIPPKDIIVEDIQLEKSQGSLFDEPEAPKNVKEPEITSVGGKWAVKGDVNATKQLHEDLKNHYKEGKINNFTEFLKSDHPLAGAVAKYHGIDMNDKNDTLHIPKEKRKEIFDNYNNITDRYKKRPSGVGQVQTRTLMSDPGGVSIGDWHFKVPTLSDDAKLELDSRSVKDTHKAANEGELGDETMNWLKRYNYVEGREAAGSEANKNRKLWDNEAQNFDYHTATEKGGLLKPSEKERMAELAKVHANEPFTSEHKTKLDALKARKSTKSLDLEKLSPEDKEEYDAIQDEKQKLQKEGAHLETNRNEEKKAAYQSVLDREQDLIQKNKGITKTDNPLSDEEQEQLKHLTDKQDFTELQKRNDDVYTPQIQKILKYPHERNTLVAPAEEEDIPADDETLDDVKPEPKGELDEHFPTDALHGKDLEHRLTAAGMGINQKYKKFYKPEEKFNYNGQVFTAQSDSGPFVMAKDEAGKVHTILKADVEKMPQGKYPEINLDTVKKHIGKEGSTLEDIYNKMGFPADHQHKDYVKNRIKRYLLKNEHNFEGAEHKPNIVRTIADKENASELDPKEKKIMYKIAKSLTPIYDYIRKAVFNYNLEKSMMIEIGGKEPTKFEKSLEGKGVLEVAEIALEKNTKIENYLAAIRSYSLEKSFPDDIYDNNLEALKRETEQFVSAHNRFDLLKSFGGDNLIKSLTEEQNKFDEEIIYKLEGDEVVAFIPETL
jgi:hypothetical protein